MRRHLASHDWPGNARELKNYAVNAVLGLNDAPEGAVQATGFPLAERLRRYEASVIEEVLRATGGNVSTARTILMVPRKTLYEKLARLSIDPARFRTRRP